MLSRLLSGVLETPSRLLVEPWRPGESLEKGVPQRDGLVLRGRAGCRSGRPWCFVSTGDGEKFRNLSAVSRIW